MKWLLPWVLIFAVGTGWAQQGPGASLGGYSGMRIDRVGLLVGGLDGTLKKMTNGVQITLLSDDPEMKPLPLKANSMTFTWPEGASAPTAIVMEGGVEINHPQATVKAGKAEWDFNKGQLVFTGNPSMDTEMFQGVQGETMVLDFNSNSFSMTGGRAERIEINRGGEAGGAGDPALLKDSDVKDWTALLTAIKTDTKAEGASPGKQILALLDPAVQSALNGSEAQQLVAQKELILKQLNTALRKPGLYSEAAWVDKTVGAGAQALLAKGALTGQEQTRLNRLLLEAAYPELIASLSPDA